MYLNLASCDAHEVGKLLNRNEHSVASMLIPATFINDLQDIQEQVDDVQIQLQSS